MRVQVRGPLIWDTSAIWSAIEPVEWGLRAVAKEVWRSRKISRPTNPHKLIEGRLTRIDPNARSTFALCSETTCLLTPQIYEEIRRKDSNFDIFLDPARCEEVEQEYGIPDFCAIVQQFRFDIRQPDPELAKRIRSYALSIGLSLDKPKKLQNWAADYDPIALAKQVGGTLVTADKKQAQLARAVGVPVIYLYMDRGV